MDLDRLFSKAKEIWGPQHDSTSHPLFTEFTFILHLKHFPVSLCQTGKLLENHLLPRTLCRTGSVLWRNHVGQVFSFTWPPTSPGPGVQLLCGCR